MTAPDGLIRTLPEILYRIAAESNPHLLSERDAGRWVSYSSSHFIDCVKAFTLGLRRLGIEPGDVVGLLAPSSPMWAVADLSIMCLGAVSVPVFPSVSARHLQHQVNNSGMRHLFVDGNARAAVAAGVCDRLTHVVGRGLNSRSIDAIDVDAVMHWGREVNRAEPALFDELADHVEADDLATIIYTSGSTGIPKGVELTQSNLVSQVLASEVRFELTRGSDVALSFLPLAHVFERMILYFYLHSGVSIYFADNIKKVGDLMREIRPTVMTVVPRLLEKIHDRITLVADETHGLRGQLARWAVARAEEDDLSAADHSAVGDMMADRLMYTRFRQAMGGRLRIVVSGGAALSADLCRFYNNIGIPLYNGYGMTECSPVVSTNCPGQNRIGSVGPLFPGIEVDVTKESVIRVRGPNVMQGYHNDESATAEVLDPDGWLVTGDMGAIDEDGYLWIHGRAKEMFKTSTGKYVCPIPIERGLSRSPFIDMAMVIADGRKFASCLIFPDTESVAKLKRKLGSAIDDGMFLRGPDLRREVSRVIDEVNKEIDQWEQIRAYRIITRVPTAGNQQLTPTGKLRRHVIEELYRNEIERMYRKGNAA